MRIGMILNMPFPQMLKTMIDCQEQSGQGASWWTRCRWLKDARAKSDADDDRAGYNRRQIAHNALYAYQFDNQCQNQIQKTGYHDTAAGVRKFLAHGHISKDAGIQICHGGKSAEESEG